MSLDSSEQSAPEEALVASPLAGIRLTPDAVQASRRYQEKNAEYAGKGLRLYVDGKGCDGFDYGVTFDDLSPTDIVFPHEEIQVIVDRETLIYVDGASISWVDDERGQGFLVENPNHKKFRGKFYRRQSWKTWAETRAQDIATQGEEFPTADSPTQQGTV